MQNYSLEYAKGITTSLLGGIYDFRLSSTQFLDLKNIFDFQYLTEQLQGLKQVYETFSEIHQLEEELVLNQKENDINPFEANFQIMVNDFLTILKMLKSQNDKLNEVLDPYVVILNELSSSLPNLTSEQIDLLKGLPKKVGDLLTNEKVSKKELQFYWSSLLTMYTSMTNNLLISSTAIQQQINEFNNQIGNISSAKTLEQGIFNGFQEFIQTIQGKGNLLEKPEPNSMYQSLLNSCLQEVKLLLSFETIWPSLSSENDAINSFLIDLLNTPLTQGNFSMTYGQFIMTEWAYGQLTNFLSENAHVGAGDIANFFSKLLSNLPSSNENTFFDVLKQQLQTIATSFSQSGSFTSWGGSMTDNSNGVISLNQNFAIDTMLGLNYQVSSLNSSLSSLSQQINNVNSNLQLAIKQLQEKSNDLNVQLSNLSLPHQFYYSTLRHVQEQFILTLSLQTAFGVVMLDGFLPEQEYYLRMLCDELYYTDQASKYLNSLIQQSTSFYNSNIYYSLTRYLNQMNLSSIPNATENAKNALSQEISRCIDDLSRIDSMKTSLTSIQAQIEEDSKLSEKDKATLLNMFNSYSNNFDSAAENLLNLKTLLLSLTIVANDTNSNSQAFTVQGPPSWSQSLAHLESLVINGDQQLTYPGGLQDIQTQLESNQQTYSNENQDQQLVLQMELAAVQQQWTIVTTSLHIINQIYSGLVNKISAN